MGKLMRMSAPTDGYMGAYSAAILVHDVDHYC